MSLRTEAEGREVFLASPGLYTLLLLHSRLSAGKILELTFPSQQQCQRPLSSARWEPIREKTKTFHINDKIHPCGLAAVVNINGDFTQRQPGISSFPPINEGWESLTCNRFPHLVFSHSHPSSTFTAFNRKTSLEAHDVNLF